MWGQIALFCRLQIWQTYDKLVCCILFTDRQEEEDPSCVGVEVGWLNISISHFQTSSLETQPKQTFQPSSGDVFSPKMFYDLKISGHLVWKEVFAIFKYVQDHLPTETDPVTHPSWENARREERGCWKQQEIWIRGEDICNFALSDPVISSLQI